MLDTQPFHLENSISTSYMLAFLWQMFGSDGGGSQVSASDVLCSTVLSRPRNQGCNFSLTSSKLFTDGTICSYSFL